MGKKIKKEEILDSFIDDILWPDQVTVSAFVKENSCTKVKSPGSLQSLNYSEWTSETREVYNLNPLRTFAKTQTLGLRSLFKPKEAINSEKRQGHLHKNILLPKNVTNTATVNLAFCQIDLMSALCSSKSHPSNTVRSANLMAILHVAYGGQRQFHG